MGILSSCTHPRDISNSYGFNKDILKNDGNKTVGPH